MNRQQKRKKSVNRTEQVALAARRAVILIQVGLAGRDDLSLGRRALCLSYRVHNVRWTAIDWKPVTSEQLGRRCA